MAGRHFVINVVGSAIGAIARTARRVRSTAVGDRLARPPLPEVEIRDLTVYEALMTTDSGGTERPAQGEIVDPEPPGRSLAPGNGRHPAGADRVLGEVGS